MLDSLPSHHDDHHGGIDGHTAHRLGFRRRRRFKAPAGTRGGRRSCFFAGCNTISNAGFLHIHGSLPNLGRAPFREIKPETERRSSRRTLISRLTSAKLERKFCFSQFPLPLRAFGTVFFPVVRY